MLKVCKYVCQLFLSKIQKKEKRPLSSKIMCPVGKNPLEKGESVDVINGVTMQGEWLDMMKVLSLWKLGDFILS